MTVYIVTSVRDEYVNLSVWSTREKAEAEIAEYLELYPRRSNLDFDIEEVEVDPDEAE